MAKGKNKILDFFGFGNAEDYDEDSDYFDEEENPAPVRTRRPVEQEEEEPRRFMRRTRVVSVQERTGARTNSVVIFSPKTYNEAQPLVQELLRQKHVIVKLDHVDKKVGQRILDFMSGAAFASDANVNKISNGIFLFASNQTEISNSDEIETEGTTEGYTLDDFNQ